MGLCDILKYCLRYYFEEPGASSTKLAVRFGVAAYTACLGSCEFSSIYGTIIIYLNFIVLPLISGWFILPVVEVEMAFLVYAIYNVVIVFSGWLKLFPFIFSN